MTEGMSIPFVEGFLSGFKKRINSNNRVASVKIKVLMTISPHI